MKLGSSRYITRRSEIMNHPIEMRYSQHIMDQYGVRRDRMPEIAQEELDIYLGMLSRQYRRLRSLETSTRVYSAAQETPKLEAQVQEARKFLGPTFNRLADALDLVGIVRSSRQEDVQRLLRTGYWISRNNR
jgi:hypothetical protein